MKRHEYFMKRMEQEIGELKPPPPPEELEQLRAEYPDMEVMTPPGCIRLAPMYSKTDEQGTAKAGDRT